MRNIRKKTQKEKRDQWKEGLQYVSVSKTGHFFWACDDCMTAFFDIDVILLDKEGSHRCPNWIRKSVFKSKEQCGERIYGGDKEAFDKYYKFVNY